MRISAFEHFHRFQDIKCYRETRSLLGSEPSAIIDNNAQFTGRKINSDAFWMLKALGRNSKASQFCVVANDEDSPISTVSGVGIIKLSGIDLFLFAHSPLSFHVFSFFFFWTSTKYSLARPPERCLFVWTRQFSNWSEECP